MSSDPDAVPTQLEIATRELQLSKPSACIGMIFDLFECVFTPYGVSCSGKTICVIFVAIA